MNDEEALKAGWKSGDAADFLGMTEAERQELDVRVSLIRAVRKRRLELGLSQKQLADRLKIGKRTMERIEAGGGETQATARWSNFNRRKL